MNNKILKILTKLSRNVSMALPNLDHIETKTLATMSNSRLVLIESPTGTPNPNLPPPHTKNLDHPQQTIYLKKIAYVTSRRSIS